MRVAIKQLSRNWLDGYRFRNRTDSPSHMRNAGAGWYYDPDDEAIYRFWDGTAWTDRRANVLPGTQSSASS